MSFKKNMEILNSNAAIISALSAMIAIGLSFFVWFHTRNILRQTERPILSIISLKAEVEERAEPELGLFGVIQYGLKNIGKNPASNLRFRCLAFQKDHLQSIEPIIDTVVVNRIDPGGEYSFYQRWSRTNEEGNTVIRKFEKYIYLLVDYKNWLKPKKHYYDEHWFSFAEGQSQPFMATVEEKKAIESMVTKYFPDRKKIK